MNSKVSRRVWTAVAVLLLGGVAACSGSGGSQTSNAGTSTEGDSGNTSAVSSSASPQPVKPTSYTLSVVAGTGQDPTGDPIKSGPATSTAIEADGVAVDSAGNVYIADGADFVVEKVTPSGQLTVFAGNGDEDAPVPGPATASPLGDMNGVVVDKSGNVFIADLDNDLIEKVTPAGQLSVFAGNGQDDDPVAGPALSSPITPHTLAIDPSGNLYVSNSNSESQQIAKITPDGQLSLVNLGGQPFGLAIDEQGNFYLSGQSTVRKLAPDGSSNVVAGNGKVTMNGGATSGPATDTYIAPDGLAVDQDGNLFIADALESANEVEEVSPQGQLSVIAGNQQNGDPVAGPATQSPLPQLGVAAHLSIAVGSSGDVIFTRPGMVLKLTPQ